MRRWLLIWAMLLPFVAAAQQKDKIPSLSRHPFQGGEKESYGLFFKWGAVVSEVGTAWLHLDSLRYEGVPAYKTTLRVQSTPFFDLFFKMREEFFSWFTADDLRPLKYSRDTFEGGYMASNLYHYDWEKGVIHADINFESRGRQVLDIPLKEGVSDLPALIYIFRAIDYSRLEEGAVYPVAFAIDDKVFDVKLTYRGQEMVKVRKLGKRSARHFSCSVVQGAMFEGNQELQFWLADDSSHTLLGLMAPLRVGAVWAWVKDKNKK